MEMSFSPVGMGESSVECFTGGVNCMSAGSASRQQSGDWSFDPRN